MKKYLIFIFIFTFIQCGRAQTTCSVRLQGYVLSAVDSSAIFNTELFVEDQHIKSRTNENGSFIIKNLCPGFILLELDLPNRKHIHLSARITLDTLLYIYVADDIVTTGSAEIRSANTVKFEINNPQLLDQTGKPLSEQLELLPGIQSLKTGNNVGKPMVQGLSGLRLPIYINGARQEGQQWGNDHGPEIDPLGSDHIEWLHGAQTLRKTHDALGGLLLLNQVFNGHNGEFDATGGWAFSTNGLQNACFGKILSRPFNKQYEWFVNSSFRRAGNLHSPNYYLLNTGLFESGLKSGIQFHKKDRTFILLGSIYLNNSGIYSGSDIGNIEDLKAAIARTEPIYGAGVFTYKISTPRQNVKHYQSSIETFNGNHRFQFSIQFDQRKEFDFHRSIKNTFAQLDLNLVYTEIQKDYNYKFNKNKAVQWGWNQGLWMNKYYGYFFIPDLIASSSGVYVLTKKYYRTWILDGSIRGDVKSINAQWSQKGNDYNKNRIFGNIAAAIDVVKNLRFGNNIGIHFSRLWRAPWINELYSLGVHHGSAAYEIGNEQLKSEIAYKAEFSCNLKTKYLDIYSAAFANYFNNFINLSPLAEPVLTVRGAFPSFEYKQFNALYQGLNALLISKIKPYFNLVTKANYVYGINIEDKKYPAYLPPLSISNSIVIKQRSFEINVEYLFVSKQKLYTPGSDYLDPPSSYTLLNGKIKINELGHKQNIKLSLEAHNLLNKSYRNYLDRFRYFSDSTGRNITLRMIINFHHHNEKTQ